MKTNDILAAEISWKLDREFEKNRAEIEAMYKSTMIKQTFADICTDELMEGAIINDEFPGFKEDYAVLHCLLRKHWVDVTTKDTNIFRSVFEIGTNMGVGTSIIYNAAQKVARSGLIVYSLDLPTELAHISLQHPISEGKGDRVGERCTSPFVQLRGDSMTFDFSKYPSYYYYIDGEHDKLHTEHETREVLKCQPEIVIYHDSDMPEVMAGIIAGVGKRKDYQLYRVIDTRIAYLLKK